MASRPVVQQARGERVVGGVISKQTKKNGGGDAKSRHALADIGNLVTVRGGLADGKPLRRREDKIRFRAKQSTEKSVVNGQRKALEKLQAGGRKPLSDISNLGKPGLQETTRKNQTTELVILEEDPPRPDQICTIMKNAIKHR